MQFCLAPCAKLANLRILANEPPEASSVEKSHQQRVMLFFNRKAILINKVRCK